MLQLLKTPTKKKSYSGRRFEVVEEMVADGYFPEKKETEG